jgi:anti-repressor protein
MYPGNPWWVAKEVCDVLDLDNVSWAVKSLDDDEKMNITISEFQSPSRGGDTGRRILINEPGLYALILRSRKPTARKFKRWITHEVIPAIRKLNSAAQKKP